MMHVKPFNEGKTYDCSNPECDNKIESKPDENKCPVCGENVIEKDTITRKRRPYYEPYFIDEDYDRYELERELGRIQSYIDHCLNRGDRDLANQYYRRYHELQDIYDRRFGSFSAYGRRI